MNQFMNNNQAQHRNQQDATFNTTQPIRPSIARNKPYSKNNEKRYTKDNSYNISKRNRHNLILTLIAFILPHLRDFTHSH